MLQPQLQLQFPLLPPPTPLPPQQKRSKRMIIQQQSKPLLPPPTPPQPQSQSQPLLPPPTPLPPQQKRSKRMIIQQQLPLLPPPIPQLDKFPMKISSRILITSYRMQPCLTLFQQIDFFLVILYWVRYDKYEKIGGAYGTTRCDYSGVQGR